MFKALCEYLYRQISKGVLGQTSTADAQNTGLGSNNASVHNDVRDDIRRADLRQLKKTFNRDLIRPYVDFNHGPQERYPQLTFPIAEPEDIKVLTDAVKVFVPMGMKVGAGTMRKKLGIPEPQPGEELLRTPGEATPPAKDDEIPSAKSDKETALNREQVVVTSEREQLADDGAADWKPQMQPIIDPMRALAERSQTAEEFLAGLPALLEEMDDTELVQQLAEGFFKSTVLGNGQQ
jgi:phage gp29-like protein